MVHKRTRSSSFDVSTYVGRLFRVATSSFWAVPQIPAQGDPKVRRALLREASLHSEPTGLPASGVLRRHYWTRTRRLPFPMSTPWPHKGSACVHKRITPPERRVAGNIFTLFHLARSRKAALWPLVQRPIRIRNKVVSPFLRRASDFGSCLARYFSPAGGHLESVVSNDLGLASQPHSQVLREMPYLFASTLARN